MDVWIVFPIGGLLVAGGILILLMLIGLWQGISSDPNVFTDFASEYTGFILILFAVAAALFGILLGYLYYSEAKYKPRKLPCVLKGIAAAIPAFLSLTVCYSWFIYLADSACQGMADGLFMTIITLVFVMPLMIIIYLIIVMIALIPNYLSMLGLNICDAEVKGEGGVLFFLMDKIYPYFVCVVLSAGYIFLLNQSNFWDIFR